MNNAFLKSHAPSEMGFTQLRAQLSKTKIHEDSVVLFIKESLPI